MVRGGHSTDMLSLFACEVDYWIEVDEKVKKWMFW
jgi:hypothetical protein